MYARTIDGSCVNSRRNFYFCIIDLNLKFNIVFQPVTPIKLSSNLKPVETVSALVVSPVDDCGAFSVIRISTYFRQMRCQCWCTNDLICCRRWRCFVLRHTSWLASWLDWFIGRSVMSRPKLTIMPAACSLVCCFSCTQPSCQRFWRVSRQFVALWWLWLWLCISSNSWRT
jgi:hypothetical protein